jgi:hypothetical protein
MHWLVRLTVLLVASLVAVGCRRPPGLVPVSGRVTLDGKPVEQMIVNLTPLGDTQGNGALACTDSEGRFTLLDSRGAAGAYVGGYKVSFYPSAGRSKQKDPAMDVVSVPDPGGLPGIYLDPNNTPLRATIPQGGATMDFILTRSGKGAITKTIPKSESK